MRTWGWITKNKPRAKNANGKACHLRTCACARVYVCEGLINQSSASAGPYATGAESSGVVTLVTWTKISVNSEVATASFTMSYKKNFP